jgi:site-specific recombinase XerD
MTSSTSIFTNGCASPGTSRNAVCLCRPQAPTRYGNTLLFVHTHRGLAAKTARKYIQKLSAFAEYLEAAGITELGRITPQHIREFYENAKNDGPRRSYGSTLRVFFRWAAVQGWLSSALRDAIPRPRQYRYVSLPDVLDQEEVDCILAAVDRTTPLGRRDYAVLVLAARYGLRPCDIRQLPLLPDVADALSAYLLDGRPASTNRTVFLRHCAPFEPFAAENNLAAIMRGALRRAGLADRPGRRSLYLFRHTLATHLLAAGHPLKAIADVLGHASTQTTYGYTRVEVDGLRGVAISEEEVIR